jgi:hypothetical protein
VFARRGGLALSEVAAGATCNRAPALNIPQAPATLQMNWLLDTDVASQASKPRPDPKVTGWLTAHDQLGVSQRADFGGDHPR